MPDPSQDARTLGRGGPRVSTLGLGCLSFGGAYGPCDSETAFACLDAAWEAGITHYDTANVYGMGVSETVLGQWLTSRQPRVTVATKSAIVPGPPRRIDNSEAHLRTELEASLRRLNVDHIALYYLHRHDPDVPIEDLAGFYARLIEEGKIGGYGLSEVAPSTLRRAHAVHPCRAVQSEYSLWTRLPELGLTRACADLGVTFVAFSPLGRGIFGERPIDPGMIAAGDFRRDNPRFVAPNLAANEGQVAAFRDFARSRGWTVAGAAIAWLLDRGGHILPVPGTRHAAHLREWAGAGRIAFTDEDRQVIDRLLPPGFAYGERYSAAQQTGSALYC